MNLSRRTLFALATVFGLTTAVPSTALAAPTKEQKRLMKKRDSERYTKKTNKSSVEAGCARIAIKADMKTTRKVVEDYKNYARFISKFQKARIVGRKGKSTDVYLQVHVLNGAGKIWAVVRFGPPKKVGNTEVIEAHMLKGNVKRLDARWILTPIDKENTQLNMELLLVPTFPAPNSLITGETAYAADEAVTGARGRAEKKFRRKKRRARNSG